MRRPKKVADIDGVSAVQVDFERAAARPTRDPSGSVRRPSGTAPTSPSGFEGSKGEGVIVGILDSGLNPANPSFADTVPESRTAATATTTTNPLGEGKYLGMCDSGQRPTQYVRPDWGCNDKLIGYYNFDPATAPPIDDATTTTATAATPSSTTAGNQVEATAYAAKGTEHEFSVTAKIKRCRPARQRHRLRRLRRAAARATRSSPRSSRRSSTTSTSSTTRSADSSRRTRGRPDAVGFLNAVRRHPRRTSAGNDGPGDATLGSPGDVPWMTTVGATHARPQVTSPRSRHHRRRRRDAARHRRATALPGATDGAYPLVVRRRTSTTRCAPGERRRSWPARTRPARSTSATAATNGRIEKGQNVADAAAQRA